MANQKKNEYWTRFWKGHAIKTHCSSITSIERKEEDAAHQLLRRVLRAEKVLAELKQEGNDIINKVFQAKQNAGFNVGKATFEFSCFDNTVTVKKDMRIKYKFIQDDLVKAKELFKQWGEETTIDIETVELLKQIETVRDGVPTNVVKHILGLREELIGDPIFAAACEVLSSSITDETFDPYFRVYEERQISTDPDENTGTYTHLVNTSLSKA